MGKSKSKKRKLAHSRPENSDNSHGKTQKSSGAQNLTHDEIWDDSALLRAWDEAAAEYEFYHSIHARGEDVEEVLKQHRAANGGDDGSKVLEAGGEVFDDDDDNDDEGDDDEEDGEIVDHGEADDREVEESGGTERQTGQSQDRSGVGRDQVDLTTSAPTQQLPSNPVQTATTNNTLPSGPAQPQTQTSVDVQHETLENLKMAYYWAGYYSGLYDGQQQALSKSQAQALAQPTTPIVPTTSDVTSVPTANSEDGEV